MYTLLVFIVVLDHVLDDKVTVRLVWVAVFIATASVLIGPFDGHVGSSLFTQTTLIVFLKSTQTKLIIFHSFYTHSDKFLHTMLHNV